VFVARGSKDSAQPNFVAVVSSSVHIYHFFISSGFFFSKPQPNLLALGYSRSIGTKATDQHQELW